MLCMMGPVFAELFLVVQASGLAQVFSCPQEEQSPFVLVRIHDSIS